MTVEFSHLNLHPQLVQAISDLGYVTPTPIQAAIIPLMLAGQDVTGQAQTGTGKTAAFSLPILQNLKAGQGYPQILVLVPTRELALQVAKAMGEYGRYLAVQVLAVYGGQPYGHQIGRLKKGVDIVVGTPGRLLDLIDKKVLDLSSIRTVVLDEADEMLSMGFIEDIESILDETPANRQTALFSATLPASVQRLAKRYLTAPQSISIRPEQPTVAAIEQRYYVVNEADKLAALTRLFEVETISSALIFVRTRAASGELANALTTRGFPAEALSGDLSQDMRERVLDRFRHEQIKVLVATDVAARGLDIDDISHVFNYDLPEDPELYVHRIGRTGRAGKTGIAISLVSPQQQWRLRRIEGFAKQKFTQASLPSVEDILSQRETQLMNQVEVWLQRGRCRRERELVAELVETGHDPLEIAAVALKLARAEEKQRPILPVSDVQEMRPRVNSGERRQKGRSNGRKESHVSHENGMVRLSLSRGKAHGVRTRDVVNTIAYTAGIPGSTIGKIYVLDKYTLVDVPEKFAAQVLAKTGDYPIRRQPMSVNLA